MRCDDIFEWSEKINNSRSWKKSDSLYLLIKSNKSWQLNTSDTSKHSTITHPPLPLTPHFNPIPSNPNSKVQPPGARGFGVVLGKLERSERLFFDTYAREAISGNDPFMGVAFQKWIFSSKNRSVVTFPRFIQIFCLISHIVRSLAKV